MAGEWPSVALSQAVTPVIGGTPSRAVTEYWNGDIPWATAKDVARVKGRHLESVEEFITREGLEKSAAKLLPKRTVLITARGTVGIRVGCCRARRPSTQTFHGATAETMGETGVCRLN
jgi:type I restriction enzyme S subunit